MSQAPIKSESEATVTMHSKLVAEKPKTTMIAPPGGLVKIRAIRTICLGVGAVKKLIRPGTEVEVTPEQAEEFCDRGFTGYYPYSGERYEDNKPATIYRAVRV